MQYQSQHIREYRRQSKLSFDKHWTMIHVKDSHLLKVNIIRKLHVLGVDAENLQTTSWIRNPNINFTIESTESSKSRIYRVGSIGCRHDHDVGTSFQAVHQGQQLGHNTTLNFSVCLFIIEYESNEMDGKRTFSRLGAIESISSMKMMAGEFFSASSNAFRKLLSLSPAILLMISGPLIRKKNAPVSLATARAISVLPVPGGPYIRIPRGGLIPMDLNS